MIDSPDEARGDVNDAEGETHGPPTWAMSTAVTTVVTYALTGQTWVALVVGAGVAGFHRWRARGSKLAEPEQEPDPFVTLDAKISKADDQERRALVARAEGALQQARRHGSSDELTMLARLTWTLVRVEGHGRGPQPTTTLIEELVQRIFAVQRSDLPWVASLIASLDEHELGRAWTIDAPRFQRSWQALGDEGRVVLVERYADLLAETGHDEHAWATLSWAVRELEDVPAEAPSGIPYRDQGPPMRWHAALRHRMATFATARGWFVAAWDAVEPLPRDDPDTVLSSVFWHFNAGHVLDACRSLVRIIDDVDDVIQRHVALTRLVTLLEDLEAIDAADAFRALLRQPRPPRPSLAAARVRLTESIAEHGAGHPLASDALYEVACAESEEGHRLAAQTTIGQAIALVEGSQGADHPQLIKLLRFAATLEVEPRAAEMRSRVIELRARHHLDAVEALRPRVSQPAE